MPVIEAIAFDLYGTLLELDDPLLHREVPRLLGVPARSWVALVRDRLLTTPFADAGEMADFISVSLTGSAATPEVGTGFAALVERELNTVRPVEGVVSLLRFLRARGFRLGLISNLSSLHKPPIHTYGLDALVDAVVLSCDEGIAKPDPEVYRRLCARLGAPPERTLLVGDSLRNDVVVPRSLGMTAARVGGRDRVSGLARTPDLGWWVLSGDDPCRALLQSGQPLPVDRPGGTVASLTPVGDESQGRYNLVYRVDLDPGPTADDRRASSRWFAKRYLSPDSAFVEELAQRLQGVLGLPACEARVAVGPEPFLLTSTAPGAKYRGELDPAIARELGRHFAFGYLFSNADLRPRNAFLARDESGRPIVTMVDMEYCFFNLAIDVANLPRPFDPDSIDALGAATLRGLVKRRVLTDRTLPRARNEFFDVRSTSEEVIGAYGEGFVRTFGEARARADELCSLVEARMRRRPFLVIGTRAYRRAMAAIDLEDIRIRLSEDPTAVLARLLSGSC